MKKKLLFSLSLLVFIVAAPVSAFAQLQPVGTYVYCGVEETVFLDPEKHNVLFGAYDTGIGQHIILNGIEEINDFEKSLVSMKVDYIVMKENMKKEGRTTMSTSFKRFSMMWSSPSNKKNTCAGDCVDIHPIFQVTRNKKSKELEGFAVIDERVKDIIRGDNPAALFVCFQNEDEIQSLIDALDLSLERLSSPSSSQRITETQSQNPAETQSQNQIEDDSQYPSEKNFWPNQRSIFDYAGKTSGVRFKGIYSPAEIDKTIMLIHCGAKYRDGNYYIAIPNEQIYNIWHSSFTGMKELFIKNDQIAKENNVTTEINKDVTDKFRFEGFFASLWNMSVYAIDRGNWPFHIKVEYRYSRGKSSMVFYVKHGDSDGTKWESIFVFESVQDFDEIIEPLSWTKFKNACNEQIQEIKNKEEKEKSDAALFD